MFDCIHLLVTGLTTAHLLALALRAAGTARRARGGVLPAALPRGRIGLRRLPDLAARRLCCKPQGAQRLVVVGLRGVVGHVHDHQCLAAAGEEGPRKLRQKVGVVVGLLLIDDRLEELRAPNRSAWLGTRKGAGRQGQHTCLRALRPPCAAASAPTGSKCSVRHGSQWRRLAKGWLMGLTGARELDKCEAACARLLGLALRARAHGEHLGGGRRRLRRCLRAGRHNQAVATEPGSVRGRTLAARSTRAMNAALS